MAKFPLDPNLLAVLLQFGFCLGFLFAVIPVRRLKRKPHFLGSALGLGAFLFTLGISVSRDWFQAQDNFLLFEVMVE